MPTGTRLEQRRATLLQGALELFAEKGFHETKVSDIVERAGVAQGTFYLYFASKRDAFDALMDSWMEPQFRIIEAAATFQPRSLEEGAARAKADIVEVFQLCADRPLLTRLMLKQAEGVGPDVSERMEDFRVQMAGYLARIIGVRQEAGLIRPLEPMVIAHAVVGMMERIVFRRFVMEEFPHLSPEQLAEQLVEFQAFGLSPHPTPE